MKELLLKSLLAGCFIAFGCISFLAAKNNILGSFLFSLGLISVILQKGALYTGRIGYLDSIGKVPEMLFILCSNLLAIWVVCFLFARYSGITLDVSAIIEQKNSELWHESLLRSIGCGAMMFIAVEGYARSHSKSLLTVVLPVMTFILCGFDHCIANYGYFAMANIVFDWHLPLWILGNAIGSLIIRWLGKNLTTTDSAPQK